MDAVVDASLTSPGVARRGADLAPLRILQIYPKADFFTGAAIQMLELVRGLAGRGHEVVVVTQPSARWAALARETGITHHALPMSWDLDLASAWKLRGIIRRHGIQVVHAQKGRGRTMTLLAGLTMRRPALVLNRGVSFPLGLNRFGYRWPGVDAIIAVCGSIKQGLVAQGVRADKIHVVYSGTDTERFHPKVDGSAVRAEAGIGPEEFLVTQIGVRSSKGNDDVMAAMTSVVRQAPHARLLIVGARRPDRLLASARACGLDPSVVRIWGYRTDIPEVLAASDCCVDASWAGLGVTGTLREALAVETPVIATALEGNVELVQDRVTGLLVPPRDPARIAEAILAMIAEPGLRHDTAQAGRRLVEARFSLRAKLDAIETLYRRLVAARDRTRA